MKFTFSYLIFNNRDFSKHDAYIKLFALFLPIVPTWLILNLTKMSANIVTLIGFLCGLTGVILGYYISIEYLLYGFLIFLILDFVDGNIAIARGGGTYLGTILDMTSDRIVLFSSVFVLTNYHLLNSQNSEILLLLTYLLTFVLLDILQLAFLRADQISTAYRKEKNVKDKAPNDFKLIIANPLIWIPSRLSSYLFVIAILMTTKSFTTAYLIGIMCVIGEFATQIIKKSKTLNQRGSD